MKKVGEVAEIYTYIYRFDQNSIKIKEIQQILPNIYHRISSLQNIEKFTKIYRA